MISRDDEGNGYHYLWYTFANVKELEEEYEFFEIDNLNESIASKEETIILG